MMSLTCLSTKVQTGLSTKVQAGLTHQEVYQSGLLPNDLGLACPGHADIQNSLDEHCHEASASTEHALNTLEDAKHGDDAEEYEDDFEPVDSAVLEVEGDLSSNM
jgi:hypothetical protein